MLIIGAGSIGLERAEALRTRGPAVAVDLPQVLSTVYVDLAALIRDERDRH